MDRKSGTIAPPPAPERLPAPQAASARGATSLLGRLPSLVYEELRAIRPMLLLVQTLLSALPPFVGTRLRVQALKLIGIQIGRGTLLADMPILAGTGGVAGRLQIGQGCWLNTGCYLELEDTITIGDRAALGQQVMILTVTHDIGSAEQRAAPTLVRRPVTIGAGAWLGARSTILPGITVGAGAVVAASTVVNRDVPPNTLVAGVPGRVIRQLPVQDGARFRPGSGSA